MRSWWLLTLSGGCIPYPHDQQRTPEVSGVLTEGGRSVAGRKVSLAANPGADVSGCPAAVHVTQSDSEGAFLLPATSERLWLFVMGDRLDTWRVCVDEVAVWEDSDWWGGPPSQTIRCDVASSSCELEDER